MIVIGLVRFCVILVRNGMFYWKIKSTNLVLNFYNVINIVYIYSWNFLIKTRFIFVMQLRKVDFFVSHEVFYLTMEWPPCKPTLSGTFRLSISLKLVARTRPSSTLGVKMLCLGLRNRAFCMQIGVDKLAENFSFGVLGPVVYIGACCAALCPLSKQVSLILVSQSSIRVSWNKDIKKTWSPYSQYWQSSLD